MLPWAHFLQHVKINKSIIFYETENVNRDSFTPDRCNAVAIRKSITFIYKKKLYNDVSVAQCSPNYVIMLILTSHESSSQDGGESNVSFSREAHTV